MKLYKFINKFIKHNTLVYIYSSKTLRNENYYENKLLCKCMDWTITNNKKKIIEIKDRNLDACKYTNNEVVKVTNTGNEFVDEIAIYIKER